MSSQTEMLTLPGKLHGVTLILVLIFVGLCEAVKDLSVRTLLQLQSFYSLHNKIRRVLLCSSFRVLTGFSIQTWFKSLWDSSVKALGMFSALTK